MGAPRVAPVGACPLCSGTERRVLFDLADRLHGTQGLFTYRRCASCGTVYQDPRVVREDLPLAYPAAYYTHVHARAPSRERASASRALRDGVRQRVIASLEGAPVMGASFWRALGRSRSVRELAFFGLLDEMIPRSGGQGRRAVEVGCGAGGLLSRLRRAGWRPEGIEWDPRAAELARSQSGCPVAVGHYRDVRLEERSFDLVILHHVLEHLEEPRDLLAWLTDVLTPEGLAILVYPNPRGLTARVFREAWHQWDPPRHLVLPPEEALKCQARAQGLRVIGARTTARTTARRFAQSRACRAGRDARREPTKAVDRLAGLFAHGLVRFGAPLGEEVVIVLGLQPPSGSA